MDLKKILKLSETNKAAACEAFSAAFSSNRITYNDGFYYARNNDGYRVNNMNNSLKIENFAFWKKFLSSFGHLLKEIRIESDQKSTFEWTEMVNLVFTHYLTLQKLRLYHYIEDDECDFISKGSSRARELSRNPLRIINACPTLESLEAENIYFGAPVNLAEYLPNLRSLDLISIVAMDTKFIEANLPRLENLGITLCDDEDFEHLNEDDDDDEDNPYRFGINPETGAVVDIPAYWRQQRNNAEIIGSHLDVKNIKNAFIYNPQLRSIQLEMCDIDMALVEFINTNLPNLKKINVSFFDDAAKNHSSPNGIVFKSVTDATLGRLGAKKPPITFKQLKSLSFNTVAYKATVDFITKHRQLSSLTLTCEYTENQALDVVKALPKLQELNMIVGNKKIWSAAGLVRLLAICERLRKLMLMIELNSKDHKNWRSYVSDTWKIRNVVDDSYVIEK